MKLLMMAPPLTAKSYVNVMVVLKVVVKYSTQMGPLWPVITSTEVPSPIAGFPSGFEREGCGPEVLNIDEV